MIASNAPWAKLEPIIVDMKECSKATMHFGSNIAFGIGVTIMLAGAGVFSAIVGFSNWGDWGLFGFLLGMAGFMFANSYVVFWRCFKLGTDIATLQINDECITVIKANGRRISVRWDAPGLKLYLSDFSPIEQRTRERWGLQQYPYYVEVRKPLGLATLVPDVAFHSMMKGVRSKGFQLFPSPIQGPLANSVVYIARSAAKPH